jgi:hypothetical protein
MREQGRLLDDIAEASGVRRASVKSWRNRSYPGLDSLEACLASLGWTLSPVPRIEVLPDDIAADLARIAAKMKIAMPEVFSALIEIAAGQTFVRERAQQRIESREAERATMGAKRTHTRRKTLAAANDNVKQSTVAA